MSAAYHRNWFFLQLTVGTLVMGVWLTDLIHLGYTPATVWMLLIGACNFTFAWNHLMSWRHRRKWNKRASCYAEVINEQR